MLAINTNRTMPRAEVCSANNEPATQGGIDRRGFVAAGVAGAAALAAYGATAGASMAQATTAEAIPMAGGVDEAGAASTTPQASADWLGVEPQISEADIVDTLTCDVLVVGCGTGGLFAACAAAEAGAQTMLIEKFSTGPGIRGTIGAVGSSYQLADDCDMSKTAICNALATYTDSNASPRLFRLWADLSAETVEWFGALNEKAGRVFTYDADHDLDEYAGQMVHKHWATGHAALNNEGATAEDATVLLDYAAELGVEVRYETTMAKLEKDGEGRVTGVIAQAADGGYVRIEAAGGTIVCTGGYARNQDMMAALQPETLKTFSYNSGLPGTTGDGIKACVWVGAAFDDTHSSMLFDRCPLPPDGIAGETMVNGMFWMSSQPWLKVNLAGQRFCNESAPYDFVLHASLHQPGHTYAVVWDSNYLDYIPQFKTQGCSRMFPFSNGAPVSAIDLDAAVGMNMGMMEAGFIQQADTIEELAQKLGIPAETLVATVERNNENYAAGEDPDFGKEAFRLSPVDAAPFYGVRTTGYMLCTMDGIHIDENINALDADGAPIDGLYVCGNDSGSFFGMSYPDQMAGLAAGRTATFARLAGRNAAAAALA